MQLVHHPHLQPNKASVRTLLLINFAEVTYRQMHLSTDTVDELGCAAVGLLDQVDDCL